MTDDADDADDADDVESPYDFAAKCFQRGSNAYLELIAQLGERDARIRAAAIRECIDIVADEVSPMHLADLRALLEKGGG
jgi:hypothetical protein